MDDDTGDARRTVSIGVSKENNEVRVMERVAGRSRGNIQCSIAVEKCGFMTKNGWKRGEEL